MQTAPALQQREAAPDYAVLRWLVGATFVVILNETIMINAIPRLMVDFDVDASAAQWLSTAFMLTMAVVIPITGWFLQRVTTRFAFGLAMVIFCTGTLLAALAWSFPVLLVARVIQASGTAVMMPLLMTTLMAVVPEHDRGRVMGNVTLAMSVAPALGPAVSGVVLQSLSWRWIFLVVLPIAAGIGDPRPAPAARRRRARCRARRLVERRHRRDRLRQPGLRAQRGRRPRRAQPRRAPRSSSGCSASAPSSGASWCCSARTGRCSTCARSRCAVFTVSLAAMSVAFMAMLGSMILLQLYLQNVRGLSPLATGLLVMPGRSGDGSARPARRQASTTAAARGCW